MNTTEVGDLLGAGREGFAEAAASLEAAGLISHKAGKVTVLDRSKLEARACECYGVVRQEIHRFLASMKAA